MGNNFVQSLNTHKSTPTATAPPNTKNPNLPPPPPPPPPVDMARYERHYSREKPHSHEYDERVSRRDRDRYQDERAYKDRTPLPIVPASLTPASMGTVPTTFSPQVSTMTPYPTTFMPTADHLGAKDAGNGQSSDMLLPNNFPGLGDRDNKDRGDRDDKDRDNNRRTDAPTDAIKPFPSVNTPVPMDQTRTMDQPMNNPTMAVFTPLPASDGGGGGYYASAANSVLPTSGAVAATPFGSNYDTSSTSTLTPTAYPLQIPSSLNQMYSSMPADLKAKLSQMFSMKCDLAMKYPAPTDSPTTLPGVTVNAPSLVPATTAPGSSANPLPLAASTTLIPSATTAPYTGKK